MMTDETLELYLPLDPADIPSAQQKGAMIRNGKIMFYEKSRVKTARKRITQMMLECAKGRTLRAEAYELHTLYVYKPATWRKKDAGKPKATRPDLDNLDKIMRDALEDSHIAFDDDGAITLSYSKKRKAHADEVPFVYMCIKPDAGEEEEQSE